MRPWSATAIVLIVGLLVAEGGTSEVGNSHKKGGGKDVREELETSEAGHAHMEAGTSEARDAHMEAGTSEVRDAHTAGGTSEVKDAHEKGETREARAAQQPRRVLFLAPISSRSHKNFFMGIANAVADSGNHVTLVTSYKAPKPRKNVREIVISMDIHHLLPNVFTKSKTVGLTTFMVTAPELCSEALAKEEVQELLEEEFDVALVSAAFSHCFLSIAHQLKIPFIWVSPAVQLGLTDQWIGNPSFPSFAGFGFMEAVHPLTFGQRALATFGNILFTELITLYTVPRTEDICRHRGLCPEDMPSLSEMQYNASLLIANGVRTLDNPARPFMPNVISVGGINCRPSQPLSQDLEEWVQGAGDDGFIFFSLGTAVVPSDMPEEFRQILVKVFGSLKQRVLWKWDQDDMPDLPPNVRLGKWLPQQDILGHPSLKLFITHGGLLSTLESSYHGIPVLGLPVMSDQQTNMLMVSSEGWGRFLIWDQLTEEALLKEILTVMTDQSLKAEAKRRSRVMKDQPQSPAEVAAYWVNYVITHKGAPHLRSPLTYMSWYQVYNVDVWLAVTTAMFVALYLLFRCYFAMFSRLCSSKGKRKLE
ncbi:UDP-glucosyltransferase 2-like [Penaeus monodon]|uniref:UDP-glucosyltransferase 2-like n=1 Tax=Penaeus monodon TaxID=6687 RepID=UPI0018A706E3|nr:UDP-glucosyltransferase 2-like [Penaeus monodon]XP_037786966.1 UDP-glucosyltransferase 2-like [Penaeus monodon]XP_037786967.1 UDP-glucosyltransferase 2-like [Penaeus monodon]